MSLRRILILVLVLSVATMWATAAYFYADLPARIPTHFDASGAPDAFAPKTLFMWFRLPLAFTVITGIFVAMAATIPTLAARYTRFLNVPDKQKFVNLPLEARIRVLEPMRDLSLMMPIPLLVLGMLMAWAGAQRMVGREAPFSPIVILVVMLSSFVCLGVTVQRMQKAIDAEKGS